MRKSIFTLAALAALVAPSIGLAGTHHRPPHKIHHKAVPHAVAPRASDFKGSDFGTGPRRLRLGSGSPMTKANLTATNNAVITTNGQGQITGAILNSLLNDIIASACTIIDATNCPLTAISGLGTGVGTALGTAVNTNGGFVTYPLSLTGATGLVRASISDWGTNVSAALGYPLNGAHGLVGYDALATDVYAALSMDSSVQAAIQNPTNGASGLAELNASSQLTSAYALSTLLISKTAPTFTSGACVGSIGTTNGTAAFTFNTGSGACGSTVTLGMPTATTGWICFAFDEASLGTSQIQQTSSGTNSVVLTTYSIGASPAAANFTVGRTIKAHCFAY